MKLCDFCHSHQELRFSVAFSFPEQILRGVIESEGCGFQIPACSWLGLVRGIVCGSRDVAINPVSLKTIGELKVRSAALSVGYEVFGSGMNFGFCALAGRQGEGRKRRIAEQLSELRNKKQRACTKNLMQALDLFGARSRNRTGTSLRTGDFKSHASTNFAIRAVAL